MAVYSKKLNADFFKIEITSGEKFEDVVKTVVGKGIKKDTTPEVKDDFFTRLEQTGDWGDDSIEGQLVRLRMNSLPDKAGFNEPLQAIGFTDEEGVGESAAFIYDKKSSVLLLERNRNAVTTFTFAEFFRQVSGLSGKINLYPVLQHDALDKVLSAKVLRKLIVRIAGPENMGAVVAEMEPSVNGMLKARKALKAPYAEFTYSVGKQRKGALDLHHGLGAIKDFLKLNQAQNEPQVEKLIVHGSAGPHDDFDIDLLEHHLEGQDTVETTKERRIPYERKRDALRRIWGQHKEELDKLYKKKEKKQEA